MRTGRPPWWVGRQRAEGTGGAPAGGPRLGEHRVSRTLIGLPGPSVSAVGRHHRRVGEAFLAAVNPGATTVPLYRAELYDKGFEPHQVKAVLLSLTTNGDFTVDAEGFMDIKLAALRAHVSQLGEWEGLEEFVLGMAEMIAKASGTGLRQAESFKAFFFD